MGSPLLYCRSSVWNVGPLTGCRPFCILWTPFKQDDLLSSFAGFCQLPTPLPAAASFLTSSVCSLLLQQTLSPDIFIQISLVILTRLHISWDRVLYPPGHKYSLEDIIVFQIRFLGFLIRQFSEVSDIAALFTLCTQAFYTKGKTKILNCVYKSCYSFHLCY